MGKLLIYYFFIYLKFLGVHNETSLQQVHSWCRNMVQYHKHNRNTHLLNQTFWQIEEKVGCQWHQIHPFLLCYRDFRKIIRFFYSKKHRKNLYFFRNCSEEPLHHKDERTFCVTYPSCQWRCYFNINWFIREGKCNKSEILPEGVEMIAVTFCSPDSITSVSVW